MENGELIMENELEGLVFSLIHLKIALMWSVGRDDLGTPL